MPLRCRHWRFQPAGPLTKPVPFHDGTRLNRDDSFMTPEVICRMSPESQATTAPRDAEMVGKRVVIIRFNLSSVTAALFCCRIGARRGFLMPHSQ
jgi:hypothetical protein